MLLSWNRSLICRWVFLWLSLNQPLPPGRIHSGSSSHFHFIVFPRILLLAVFCLHVHALRADTEAVSASAERRMNILMLYADDWRHDTLSAAGNPVVQTPHLDRLAAGGVRFTQSYVTTAICGVSRASLYTGQWMSRHGNRGFDPFETPWEETYLGLLREHGYHVGHVGKWHNGKIPSERFDFSRSYYGVHWMEQPDGSKIHVTQKNENDAIDFLRERPGERPFYLTVAFFATHAEDHNPLQFLPQPESMDLYANVEIPVPSNANDESFHRLPAGVAHGGNEGRHRYHWRFDTPEKYQIMMKNYFRMATEVDATCQRILDELEAQGVLDHTLVIFTTDNGFFHGEHGLADKWYPHEESIRVPLIIHDPRLPANRQGQLNADITLNVDLAPTILSAAGIKPPATMQGRDLAPLYLDKTPADWRTDFFYEHPTYRSADFIPASEALVLRDWKYMYWPEFQVSQLFDLRADPREEDDLSNNATHAERLDQMRRRFAELKAQAQ